MCAPNFRADVLVRRGDAMKAGQAAMEPAAMTPEDQAERFGYNCDFIGFMPLPKGSNNFVHPDTLTVDPKGRLFVATDGAIGFGLPDEW